MARLQLLQPYFDQFGLMLSDASISTDKESSEYLPRKIIETNESQT